MNDNILYQLQRLLDQLRAAERVRRDRPSFDESDHNLLRTATIATDLNTDSESTDRVMLMKI